MLRTPLPPEEVSADAAKACHGAIGQSRWAETVTPEATMYWMTVLWMAGCTSVELTASPTNVAGTVRLEWTTDHEDPWISWSGPYGRSHRVEGTEVEPGQYEALLVGWPDAALTYDLMTADGVVIGSGETVTEPSDFPLELESSEGTFSSSTLTTVFTGDTWVPAILDEEGEVRWWFDTEFVSMVDGEPSPQDISIRARATSDGIWLNLFSNEPDTYNLSPGFMFVNWAGEEQLFWEQRNNHHDFWVFEDGSLAWIEFVKLDDEVWGDRVLRSADNESFEIIYTMEGDEQLPELISSRGDAYAWANHLAFDGTHYWLSVRNLDLVFKIDETGQVRSSIGQGGSVGVDEAFAGQHGGVPTSEGLLLHDNKGGDSIRVNEYRLDDEASSGTLIWQYKADESWVSEALGDALRTESGMTRIVWGVYSVMEEVDEGGQRLARVDYESSGLFGYIEEVSFLDGE